MSRVKVLHILSSDQAYGVKRFVRDTIQYADSNEFEQAVCILGKPGMPGIPLEIEGVQMYSIEMTDGFSFTKSFELMSIIKSSGARIVHCHTFNLITSIVLNFYRRIKLVYFEHGEIMNHDVPPIRRKIYRQLFRLFIRKYDLILTNTEYMRNKLADFTGTKPERITVHNYGIDLAKYSAEKNMALRKSLGIPDDYKVVGIIGKLVEQKGIDDFIRVARVMNRGIKAAFLIVGDGPRRKAYEQAANEMDVEVIFLGERQDIPNVLRIFDLYVATARFEPSGLSAIEALASRVPIVGFEVPVLKEIIEKNRGGILMSYRHAAKLANLALDLLEDPRRYNRIAEEGFHNARTHYNLSKTVRILEGYYKKLLGLA